MKKIIIPIALCLFMSCQSMQQTSDRSNDVDTMQNLQEEFMSTSEEDECMPWENIIKNPEYKKLPDDLRQDIRNRYFDDCLMENIDDKDEYKEYHKFFISALEAEKRAGLGNYMNCVSGDCKNGEGTLEYCKGVRYTGQFKDGKNDGNGTLTWSNGYRSAGRGIEYTGEFKDDLPNGKGTYFHLPSKNKYVGQVKDDKMHGTGTHIWADGAKYEGEWEDDKKHGEGTYTWPDGEKYTGQWEDDEMHGKGILYDPDGIILKKGNFEYGEYVGE